MTSVQVTVCYNDNFRSNSDCIRIRVALPSQKSVVWRVLTSRILEHLRKN